MHKKRSVAEVLFELMKRNSDVSANELWRRTGIPQPTISRILKGESLDPDTSTLGPIAEYFRITVPQLRGELALPWEEDDGIHAQQSTAAYGNMVPLISWSTAAKCCADRAQKLSDEDAEEWLPSPVTYKPGLFALTVSGDSMDDGTDKGYRDGELIFVDPQLNAHHNDDVLAMTPDSRVTFKRFQITPDGHMLLALNQAYPGRIQAIPDATEICGVVVFSGKRRR